MSERASDRFTVEAVAKKSNLLRGLLEVVLLQQTSDAPEDELIVRDRGDASIVYREPIEEGPYVASRVEEIRADLESLDADAFRNKYGITAKPPSESAG